MQFSAVKKRGWAPGITPFTMMPMPLLLQSEVSDPEKCHQFETLCDGHAHY